MAMVIQKQVEDWNRLCATQEQANRTNCVKHHTDKISESPLCRLCDKKGEIVQHLLSGCENCSQEKDKGRHDTAM